jgi:hypothetical protein
VYELDRLDFAEAYLVAQAEATGINKVLSLGHSIDRLATSRSASAESARHRWVKPVVAPRGISISIHLRTLLERGASTSYRPRATVVA